MRDDVLLHLETKGGSGRLIEDFRAVAEATAADGAPRYARDQVLGRLARFLAGQEGGPNRDAPLYELCHLVNAVDAAGDARNRRFDFFMGPGRPLPASLRRCLERALGAGSWRRSGFAITADGVAIGYGGSSFAVRFGRMPFLVSLYEFLSGMEGTAGETSAYFQELNAVFDRMIAEGPTAAAIQGASNEISRHLRQYRRKYLFGAPQEDKFARLIGFLRERSEGRRVRIDDAQVLAFWLACAGNAGVGDFRKYRSVFEAFMALLASLDRNGLRRSLSEAASIGPDRERGEVEPEDAGPGLDGYSDWVSPLGVLDEDPASRINFLKKSSERAPLQLLMTHGPRAARLPLSLLRAEVFGAVQSKITVARSVRKGRADSSVRAACESAVAYRQWLAIHRRLLEHIKRAQLATFHALRQGDRTGSDPRPGMAPMRALGAEELFDAARRSLAAEEIPPEAMDALLADAEAAFAGFGRRGFQDADLEDETHLEAFRSAAAALTEIATVLRAYLGRIGVLELGDLCLDGRFARDCETFLAQFEELYGDGR